MVRARFITTPFSFSFFFALLIMLFSPLSFLKMYSKSRKLSGGFLKICVEELFKEGEEVCIIFVVRFLK